MYRGSKGGEERREGGSGWGGLIQHPDGAVNLETLESPAGFIGPLSLLVGDLHPSQRAQMEQLWLPLKRIHSLGPQCVAD